MRAKLAGFELDPEPALNVAELFTGISAISGGHVPDFDNPGDFIAMNLPDVPEIGPLAGWLPAGIRMGSYRPWIMVAVVAIAVIMGTYGWTYEIDPSDDDWRDGVKLLAKGMVETLWKYQPYKRLRPYLGSLVSAIEVVFSLGFTPQAIAIWLATADFKVVNVDKASIFVKSLSVYAKSGVTHIDSMWDIDIILTPTVMNKILDFWTFPFNNPKDKAIRDQFERLFNNMQLLPQYGGTMLHSFSDQLASYLISVLTYVSIETPAFSISDPLIHMQGIFTNLVNKMAGYKSASADFVNYVTDLLRNYSFERVGKAVIGAVEDVVRKVIIDKLAPQVSAQVSGYGTLGIVAIVGVGIFLAYQ
jgi:hypothetical protein